MELKGIPDGDETLVCTNWDCPTSIVVNAVKYDVVTNWWRGVLEFDVMTTNLPPEKIAGGKVRIESGGREARLAAFAAISCTDMSLHMFAQGIRVQPIDSTTNMMFLTEANCDPTATQYLIYKNIHVCYDVVNVATNSVATNALVFTAALINEGLPEEDRISLMSMP